MQSVWGQEEAIGAISTSGIMKWNPTQSWDGQVDIAGPVRRGSDLAGLAGARGQRNSAALPSWGVGAKNWLA
jgi:hypothetical protein